MPTRPLTALLMSLLLMPLLFTSPRHSHAAENLYFPSSDDSWETVSPQSVGWDGEKLNAALALAGQRRSSGVVILHGGRILAERYWDDPDDSARYLNMVTGRDSRGRAIEDVASAQKSVVAVLTGMAQERGYLQIDDPVSHYVGAGWSKLAVSQEAAVTIRHLLSMNSGLATDFSYAGRVRISRWDSRLARASWRDSV